ncbi:MAG: geranylgeranylglyceryl phosphate synthase family protein [Flavobacteriia bacterium]|nr:geranylgeranylglyceryl phosphate synthase family protein [Flavobacteriia bacterium]
MLRKNEVITKIQSGIGQIAILIDPEKTNNSVQILELIKKCEEAQIDFFFIGGSTVTKSQFDYTISLLNENTKIPIVIFPGSHHQISKNADAILYLSLISGRNPDYLIGHHIQSAQEIINLNIEIIPTGYILIDGGTKSTVAYISQTTPIPINQISIAINTATAGVLQGKKIIFYDAGSGANECVPIELIEKTKFLNTPIIIGGGIKTISQIKAYKTAGVNIIVIGNHIEQNPNFLTEIKKLKM